MNDQTIKEAVPDAKAIPVRTEAVQARKVGRDTLLMHTILKQYHVLNDVAGRIWELADGTKSLDSIAVILAGEYAESVEMIREDVLSTVAGLESLQVIDLRREP